MAPRLLCHCTSVGPTSCFYWASKLLRGTFWARFKTLKTLNTSNPSAAAFDGSAPSIDLTLQRLLPFHQRHQKRFHQHRQVLSPIQINENPKMQSSHGFVIFLESSRTHSSKSWEKHVKTSPPKYRTCHLSRKMTSDMSQVHRPRKMRKAETEARPQCF